MKNIIEEIKEKIDDLPPKELWLSEIPGVRKFGKFLIKKFFLKEEIIDLRRYKNCENAKVITLNHTNIRDIPVIYALLEDNFFVVAGKEYLDFVSKLLFKIIGVYLIDRKNPENNKNLDANVTHTIKRGRKAAFCMEGTWNNHQAILVLPSKLGTAKAAYNSNTSPQALCLEYIDNRIFVLDNFPTKFDEKKKNESLTDYLSRNNENLRGDLGVLKHIFIECVNKYSDTKDIAKMYNDYIEYYIEGKIPKKDSEILKENKPFISSDDMKKYYERKDKAEEDFNNRVNFYRSEGPEVDLDLEKNCYYRPLSEEDVYENIGVEFSYYKYKKDLYKITKKQTSRDKEDILKKCLKNFKRSSKEIFVSKDHLVEFMLNSYYCLGEDITYFTEKILSQTEDLNTNETIDFIVKNYSLSDKHSFIESIDENYIKLLRKED